MKKIVLEFCDIEDDMSDEYIEEYYKPHAIFFKDGVSFCFDKVYFNKLTNSFTFALKNNLVATYKTHDIEEIEFIRAFVLKYSLQPNKYLVF